MCFFRRISGLLFFVLLAGISMGSFAQAAMTQPKEVSDKELENFVEAVGYVQVIQEESQQEMIATVQEEGIDVQRFIEIQQAQHNQNEEIDVTPTEMEKYISVNQKLDVIHENSQKQMEKKISESGLTTVRYQEIGSMVQNDPVLQEKFQKLMEM